MFLRALLLGWKLEHSVRKQPAVHNIKRFFLLKGFFFQDNLTQSLAQWRTVLIFYEKPLLKLYNQTNHSLFRYDVINHPERFCFT